jgi:hypothetical protein
MQQMDKGRVVFSEELFDKFVQDTHFLLTYELHFLMKVMRENYPELLSQELCSYFDSLPYFSNRQVKESHGLFFVKHFYVRVEEAEKGDRTFKLHKRFADYIVSKLKDIVDEAVENDVLLYFLTSLTNLYGCLSTEQFLIVWHRYNKIAVSEEKVIQICQHLSKQKYPFRYEKTYIVQEMLRPNELEEMLSYVEGKPYYLPTAEEVGLYTAGIIERTAEAYIRMVDYLSNHPGGLEQSNLNQLIENIAYALKFNSDFKNILRVFDLMNYKFDEDDDQKVLEGIIDFSRKNTRKWINRGFTDLEMASQH